ncbi:divalent-cation tolerance protein CutA [Umezawaea tangerina]|uniref:divalent-cation tolerance protein CutA n=1 Tax=Umezawaea tangerina TaxID=84725 RepID=UPI000D07F4BA|nr:divalent-cation tolerance protein CutA [Umezawaea tangerina]
MDKYLQVTTATATRAQAISLARSAVADRLAGGVQIIGPVTSVYRHHGEINESEEWKVIFKTTETRYVALEIHLQENHPWDNPEIIATVIAEAPAAYLAWLAEATNPDTTDD